MKNRNHFRIFYLLALASITASMAAPSALAQEAGACPTVQLDDEPVFNMPVWDQRNTQACYVFAASYLASVYIRQEWAKADPSLASFIDEPKSTNKDLQKSPKIALILDAEYGRTCQSANFIFERLHASLSPEVQAKVKIPTCKMTGIDLDASGQHYNLQSPEAIESELHHHLVAESKPIGIEYCSTVFFDYKSEFIKNRTFRAPLTYLNNKAASENFSKKCGFHAAVITGQKIRNGECYFRVRNSDGESQIPKKNIEQGYYWIPANALARSMFRMITL